MQSGGGSRDTRLLPGGSLKACRVVAATLVDDARTDETKQPLHLKSQHPVGFHNGLTAHDGQDGRRRLRQRGYASLIDFAHRPRIRKDRGFFSRKAKLAAARRAQ